jgi:hypothetical protein
MWVQDPSALGGIWGKLGSPSPMVWDSTGGSPDALSACYNLDYAGYQDWRLPNLKELISIVDYGRVGPAVDPLFTNTVSGSYWSSTTYAGYTDVAWIVSFNGGSPVNDYKTGTYYVRCVRGQ